MDPLSVSASIVGILAAAAKVAEILGPIVSNVKDAPRVFASVVAEVNDMRTVLSSLQQFLLNLASVLPGRTALIQLDELIVTLTDAVLNYSELEALLPSLGVTSGSQPSKKSRLRWVMKQTTIQGSLEKLQRNKSSLSLILNILQWYILLL